MKTLVLTVSRDGVYCGGFLGGLMECMGSPLWGGFLRMERESDVPRARSRLLHLALEQPFDRFLWVDDDMVFRRAQFEEIVTAPGDVVAGVYCKRRHEGGLVCSGIDHAEEHAEDRDMVRVAHAGTGFLRMTRDAVEFVRAECKLPVAADGWTHFFNNGFAADGRYLTEDYAFCANCAAAGVPVWLHRRVRVGHFGSEVFAS